MIIKEVIEHLQTYRPDQPCAYTVWLADDVKSRAKEMKVRLTKDEIVHVLERVHHKQDASIGINWDTIDYWIDEVRNGRRQ